MVNDILPLKPTEILRDPKTVKNIPLIMSVVTHDGVSILGTGMMCGGCTAISDPSNFIFLVLTLTATITLTKIGKTTLVLTSTKTFIIVLISKCFESVSNCPKC